MENLKEGTIECTAWDIVNNDKGENFLRLSRPGLVAYLKLEKRIIRRLSDELVGVLERWDDEPLVAPTKKETK